MFTISWLNTDENKSYNIMIKFNKDKISIIFLYASQIIILGLSFFLRFVPLTLFVFLILFIRIYVHFKPDSAFAKILGMWVGPFPKNHELRSTFIIRTGIFSLLIAISLGIIIYCGMIILQRHQFLNGNPWFMGICIFVCPVLTLVFFVDSIGKLGKGFFVKYFGKEGEYIVEEPPSESENHICK